MKPVMLAIACVIVASPIFGQEVDLGVGTDASSLLNLPAPRGNVPARGTSSAGSDETSRGAGAPPVDRLVRLRELLVGANLPLAKEQEAALNSFLSAEIPAMRRALQERIAELEKKRGSGGGLQNENRSTATRDALESHQAPYPNATFGIGGEMTPGVIRFVTYYFFRIVFST